MPYGLPCVLQRPSSDGINQPFDAKVMCYF